MARKFQELIDRMSPERQARVRAESRRMLAELAPANGHDRAGNGPPRPGPEVTVSDLRQMAVEMGGTLEITVRFPDRSTPVAVEVAELAGQT